MWLHISFFICLFVLERGGANLFSFFAVNFARKFGMRLMDVNLSIEEDNW